MTSLDGEHPASDRPLDPEAALAEIERAQAGIRHGLRWHAADLTCAAAILVAAPIVRHFYPEQVAVFFWIAVPVALALALSTEWLRRVIGRAEVRLGQYAMVVGIALSVSASMLLDRLSDPGTALALGIATTPAVPVLAAVVRILVK
ncbi:hypothetical protein O7627_09255 [Solwaraspora sp. WMMD1047]|uniref:hypothetical protein n=1 Tax=Solwaraspora sp. WMMD1047 TaxID=3016102 RepID=UPI002417C99B|nr:hypothetical protein [Solwaraspora sp. WMMD1047]MDG4829488.1 hypothetical protein [Solwaraspora sp. WMMD1047]